MSIRDWLMIAGFVVLVIVALDGLRRMRNRGRLKLDIDPKFKDLPDEDLSAELPNGGARRAGGKVAAHVEPTFSEAPLKADARDADTPVAAKAKPRVEAPVVARRDDDDFDLLLEGDLKGVGEGADTWLDDPLADGVIGTRRRVKQSEPVFEPEIEASPVTDPESGEVEAAAPAWVAEADPYPEPAVEAPEEAPLATAVEAAWEAPTEPTEVEVSMEEPPVPWGDDDAFDIVPEPEPEPEPETAVALEGAELSPEPEPDRQPEAPCEEKPTLSVVDSDPTGLDLNQPVPQLMEQMARLRAESPAEVDAPSTQSQREPEAAPETDVAGKREPTLSEPKKPAKPVRGRKEIQTNFFDEIPDLAPEPEPEPRKPKPSRLAKKKAKAAEAREAAKRAEERDEEVVDEVLVITVTARSQPFPGPPLFKLVEACDLHYGEMDIYHRHEQPNARGPVQFSMANAVKPGTFAARNDAGFSTPAVTFFLKMGEPSDLPNAFDCMLATAQCVADHLDGVLKDENRSVMRSQTIEHYRQRIRDHERRRLTRRA